MADGAIGWWEIDVPDIERAQQFYGAVCPWMLQPMEGYAGYVIVNVSGQGIGALQASEGGEPSGRGVTLYVDVPDLEATLEKAKREGATVLQERMEVPGPSWIGLIKDPFGTKIGFVTTNRAG
ncbi:MAG TPA: VOC family protein [Candidatus Dormibacteraeota bacterium]|nr:VOC family protein [Candidatus Dormibacteraeota bacterium]